MNENAYVIVMETDAIWDDFGCDFSNCYPNLHCGRLKHNVSIAVSSDLL